MSKNGVCVCADRRNRREYYSSGKIETSGGRNKIYRFNDDILIYNHGVNEFNGLSWEELCSKYKESDEWENRSLFDVASGFKGFAANTVREQLKNHYNSGKLDAIRTGFVFLGKTSYDTNFKIYELWWVYDSSLDPQPVSLDNEGLVRSGDGKDFLQNFLGNNPDFTKPRYWKGLNIIQTKEELIKLFLIAFYEQGRRKKDVFSRDYNTACIPDLAEK